MEVVKKVEGGGGGGIPTRHRANCVHEQRKGGDSPFGQSDRLANALTYGTDVALLVHLQTPCRDVTSRYDDPRRLW